MLQITRIPTKATCNILISLVKQEKIVRNMRKMHHNNE